MASAMRCRRQFSCSKRAGFIAGRRAWSKFTRQTMQYLRRCRLGHNPLICGVSSPRPVVFRERSASRSLPRRRRRSRSILAPTVIGVIGSVGYSIRPPGEDFVALGDRKHHAAGNPILHFGGARPDFGGSIAPVSGVFYLVGHIGVKKSHAGLPGAFGARGTIGLERDHGSTHGRRWLERLVDPLALR